MWGPLGVGKWGTQLNSYLKEVKEPYAKVRGRTDEAEGTSRKAPRQVFEEHGDQHLRVQCAQAEKRGVRPPWLTGHASPRSQRRAFRCIFSAVETSEGC